jgi:hypothetical protein
MAMVPRSTYLPCLTLVDAQIYHAQVAVGSVETGRGNSRRAGTCELVPRTGDGMDGIVSLRGGDHSYE